MADYVARAEIDLGLDKLQGQLDSVLKRLREMQDIADQKFQNIGKGTSPDLLNKQAEAIKNLTAQQNAMTAALVKLSGAEKKAADETVKGEARKSKAVKNSLAIEDERVKLLARREEKLKKIVEDTAKAYDVSTGSVKKAFKIIQDSVSSLDEADAASKEYNRTLKEQAELLKSKVGESYKFADAAANEYWKTLRSKVAEGYKEADAAAQAYWKTLKNEVGNSYKEADAEAQQYWKTLKNKVAKSYKEADAAAQEYNRTLREKVAKSYEYADAAAQEYQNGLRRQREELEKSYSAAKKQVGVLEGLGKIENQVGAEAKLSAFKIRSLQTELTKLERAGFSVDNLRKRLYALQERTKSVNKTVRESTGLWERFGKAAVVFTLFYRGINAVEAGLRKMVETIKEGIQMSNELGEIQGKMALWGTMFKTNAKSFGDAFQKARVNVAALREELPRTTSSISDLSQGFDELAQHGIFATSKMMPQVVKFIDLVSMLAKNSTMSANQIRQEFNSLFEGNVRAGNSLLMLLRNLGKDTAKLREDLKHGRNVVENFQTIMNLLTKDVDEYREAVWKASGSAAYTRWSNQLQKIIADSVDIAAVTDQVGNKINVFSNVLLKHAKVLRGSGDLSERWAGVMETLASILDSVLSAAEKYMQYLPGLIQLTKEYAGSIFMVAAGYEAAKVAVNAFMKVKLANSLKELISPTTAWAAAITIAAIAFDKLTASVDKFEKHQENLAEGFDNFIKNVPAGLEDVASKMQETYEAQLDQTGNEISSRAEAFREAMKENSFMKTFMPDESELSGTGVISKAVGNVFKSVVDSAGKALEEASEKIKIQMKNAGQGLEEGLVGEGQGEGGLGDKVVKKLESVAYKLRKTLNIGSAESEYMQKIQRVVEKYKEIELKGKELARQAPEIFNKYFGSMNEFMASVWKASSEEQDRLAEKRIENINKAAEKIKKAEEKLFNLRVGYMGKIAAKDKDNLEARLRRNDAWLEQQYRIIEALEQTGASTDKVNEAIEAAGKAYDKMNQEAHWDKVRNQYKSIQKQVKETTRMMTDLWTSSMRNMRDFTRDFFVNALEGDFSNIGKSFERMVTKMISEWAAMQMQTALFGNVAGKLGGLIGAGVGAIGDWWDNRLTNVAANDYTGWGVAMMHSGGTVGQNSSGTRSVNLGAVGPVPRFHDGLKAGEFLTVLESGEEVIPVDEVGKDKVTVNVYEAPGTRTEVRQEQNQDGLSIDVLISQIEDKMSANVAVGRGSLAPTLQQTYGLNRTAGAYR